MHSTPLPRFLQQKQPHGQKEDLSEKTASHFPRAFGRFGLQRLLSGNKSALCTLQVPSVKDSPVPRPQGAPVSPPSSHGSPSWHCSSEKHTGEGLCYQGWDGKSPSLCLLAFLVPAGRLGEREALLNKCGHPIMQIGCSESSLVNVCESAENKRVQNPGTSSITGSPKSPEQDREVPRSVLKPSSSKCFTKGHLSIHDGGHRPLSQTEKEAKGRARAFLLSRPLHLSLSSSSNPSLARCLTSCFTSSGETVSVLSLTTRSRRAGTRSSHLTCLLLRDPPISSECALSNYRDGEGT